MLRGSPPKIICVLARGGSLRDFVTLLQVHAGLPAPSGMLACYGTHAFYRRALHAKERKGHGSFGIPKTEDLFTENLLYVLIVLLFILCPY
jgi:hypothetical protein